MDLSPRTMVTLVVAYPSVIRQDGIGTGWISWGNFQKEQWGTAFGMDFTIVQALDILFLDPLDDDG